MRGRIASLFGVALIACIGPLAPPAAAGDMPRDAYPLLLAQQDAPPSPACNIKGNISSSGERIYHVPGARYYTRTIINPRKGERWFCSEAEARAAGWRRSKV